MKILKREKDLFKTVFMTFLITTTMVSCGDNKSGSGGSSGPNNGISVYGGADMYGGAQINNYVRTISQESQCQQGGSRTKISIPLQGVNINTGSIYFGKTAQGDIAVIQNQNGQSIMEVLLCPRSGLSGQGRLIGNSVVVNSSYSCPFSEITAASIELNSNQFGPVPLAFYPIDIDGRSSLCQGGSYY